MSIIDAIILGLIQGLTEFIPISSSGHLAIATRLTPLEGGFEFDVLINIGTLCALILFFRAKLWDIAKRLKQGDDSRLARNIIISTIPAVILGGVFGDFFASDALRSEYVVIATLFIVGVLMIIPWKIPTTPDKHESLYRLPKPEAVYIGLAQALALIPGTSRSGITILAGRLCKLPFNRAAEYSFLLAIPIMTGAIGKTLLESEGREFLSNNLTPLIIGNIVAFISGFLAIRFLMKFLANTGLWVFGYYRIALAVVLLIIVL
jgi:undecaprenyl-diphosphatase